MLECTQKLLLTLGSHAQQGLLSVRRCLSRFKLPSINNTTYLTGCEDLDFAEIITFERETGTVADYSTHGPTRQLAVVRMHVCTVYMAAAGANLALCLGRRFALYFLTTLSEH